MEKIFQVALIGCGQMGAVHLENIYYKENVHIKYVCDLNKERAKEFQRKYNAEKTTDSVEECVSDPEVDIVIIATYPSTHLPFLKKCLQHKKHVLCEKPIATNLQDGKEFVRLVKENSDCKVLVGHILRHNHSYNMVGRMIRRGAIGSPIIMRMTQNHHTMNWDRYLTLINETSPIVDCGVHYIDVMQWFTGAKIESVSGIGQRTEPDVPCNKYNYGLITVKLTDGSVGYYEAGWTNTISSDNHKEFIGPKGSIKIIFKKDRMSHQEEGDLIEYYRYPEKTYEIINVQGERKPTDIQFDYLIKMITENYPGNPNIDDVYECFKIAMEADALITGKENH